MDKPVFVKIDEYQEILNILDVIKSNLLKAQQTVSNINTLKKKEDQILANWNTNIEGIAKKVSEISTTLFDSK